MTRPEIAPGIRRLDPDAVFGPGRALSEMEPDGTTISSHIANLTPDERAILDYHRAIWEDDMNRLTPHEREQLYHGDEPEGDGSPMGLVVLAASIGAALIVAGAVALAMQAGWLL